MKGFSVEGFLLEWCKGEEGGERQKRLEIED